MAKKTKHPNIGMHLYQGTGIFFCTSEVNIAFRRVCIIWCLACLFLDDMIDAGFNGN